MPKILICAATRTETEGARLGIRRAGLEGRFEILRTGIGPLHAARALEKHLSATEPREKPGQIISTGFAGSWSPDLHVGEWIEARSVCDESEKTFDLTQESAARAAILCSVATIHASPPLELIRRISEKNSKDGLPIAVDMESFALAKIAAQYGIRASAVRYVTDSPEMPLPDFVRHFTRVASEEELAPRAGAALEGARALIGLAMRRPSAMTAFLRDGTHWRDELITGWARFAGSFAH